MTELSNDEEIDLLVQEDFDFDERSERSFFRKSSLLNTYIRELHDMMNLHILRRMLRFLASLQINFGPMNTLSLMYYTVGDKLNDPTNKCTFDLRHKLNAL